MIIHTKILLIVSLLLFQSILYAQSDDFFVREETRSLSSGAHNALVGSWDKASTKIIGKTWKKFIKKYKGKVSYDRQTDTYFADNAEVKAMSENAVDIRAKVEEKGEGAEIVVWFNLGVTYLNSSEHPERYPAAAEILKKFDLAVFAELAKQALKDEQKALRKMNQELKKIERAKKKEDKKIEKAEKIIAKAEKDIEEAEEAKLEQMTAEQEQKTEIEQQEESIRAIKAKLKQAKKM